MLNINFVIDEEILAREIISRSCMPTEFANYLWDKYNSSYIKLQRLVICKEIDINILSEVKKQKFFKDIYNIATANLERIRNAWEKQKEIINKFLLTIMRVDFQLNMDCYIVSPNLNAGHNIGNNKFVWGHELGINDINYDLVYLIHESLHSYFDQDTLSHTIIEKISDIELSRLLNSKNKVYSVHDFTQKFHIKIFPFWNLYLNKTKQEIIEEQNFFNTDYDIEKFEKYRNKLKLMHINQFIEFVKTKIEKINYKQYYKIF